MKPGPHSGAGEIIAYATRIVDNEIRRLLASSGCVVLEGPKAVGKTESARQVAASTVLLDVDPNALALAAVDPKLLLDGPAPRLIDEWQLEPRLWNQVRREVDARGLPGQFILTGSAVPADDLSRHTGAGRMTRLSMRPMSLFESGQSTGEISLPALFAGSPPRASDTGATVSEIVDRICISGWPLLTSFDPTAAQRALRSYLEEITRTDIHRVDGVRRDPARVRRLLASLARNTGTATSVSSVAADTGGPDGPLQRETAIEYLRSLDRLMVLENVPAWAPALRSRARLRSAETRHFVDPGLAVAALAASPERLLADLNFLGFLFEGLVLRDMRVYAQDFGGRVLNYRDSNDFEVDLIIETEDGRWAAAEVKLGSNQVDAAAAALLRVTAGIDTTRVGEPAFLAVITATGYGYTRPDGVHVLPITTLAP